MAIPTNPTITQAILHDDVLITVGKLGASIRISVRVVKGDYEYLGFNLTPAQARQLAADLTANAQSLDGKLP